MQPCTELRLGLPRSRLRRFVRAAIGNFLGGEWAELAEVGEAVWAEFHAVDMTGRFGLFTWFGTSVHNQGIFDSTDALDFFDSTVAECQAQNGYPNVP